MMRTRSVAALFVVTLAVGGCVPTPLSGEPNPNDVPLSPLYNITPDMIRPDGTMTNGLLPINPNYQH